jgi:hypothetical protein
MGGVKFVDNCGAILAPHRTAAHSTAQHSTVIYNDGPDHGYGHGHGL